MAVVNSSCMLCVWDCGIKAHVEDGKLVKTEGLPEHPVSNGYVCPRGENLPAYVYSDSRLLYPYRRKNNTLERITWDQAFDICAENLTKVKEKYGAKSLAIFCGSVGVENIEVAAFAQRFKSAYNTPNLLSVENICYRLRILARQLTFGRYVGEDYRQAECMILWGHNPDGSRKMLGDLIREKVANEKFELIVIDPKRTELAKLGLHLQIRPGTDAALALAMLNVIINEDRCDKEFVENYTKGFPELKEHIQQYTPEWAADITGIPKEDIKVVARIFAQSKAPCILQGINTLDQHRNGFQNSRLLALLQIVVGAIDKPGTWVTIPFLRMADLRLPMEEKPIGADEYPIFHSVWGRVSPYGIATLFPKAVLEGIPYPMKASIVTAANPLVTYPDSGLYRKAFEALDFRVSIDPFINETAELSDVLLPACTFLEKDSLGYVYGVVNCEPYAMLRKKVIEPLGESRPDWWIWTELAKRMGLGEYFTWTSDEEVFDFLLEPSGIKEELKNKLGVYFAEKGYYQYKTKPFPTPSKKIEIYSDTLKEYGYDPLPGYVEPAQSPISTPELYKEYPIILISGARQEEYAHSQQRNIPALRALNPEPLAEMHPATAQRYGLVDGEKVNISTKVGTVKMRLKTNENMMTGVVTVPHGWGLANVNEITNVETREPITGYPDFKAILVRVEPAS
ncbi:MAG: molybdopterin-dependent oxidoreductase [Firmicutes bacterium]|jgi:anaerobic selenocysteine-containing dehydrogenase|nr:molybdopterin-dependent oxidoreductase [Bacillota bacterium]